MRLRDDKQVEQPDVRFEQVSDLVAVAPETSASVELPPSRVLHREVYTKATQGGQAVRKLVTWATNKHDADPRFPRFAVLFTDYRGPHLRRDTRATAPATRWLTVPDHAARAASTKWCGGAFRTSAAAPTYWSTTSTA